MRAVVERVSKAGVKVEGKLVSEIEKGFLVLLAIKKDDREKEALAMAKKIVDLRIFSDDGDKMNLSLKDVGGEILLISQFTLYGDTKKGNRPNFMDSARPQEAKRLFDLVFKNIKDREVNVKEGVFQTDMKVSLINDGPVTIIIDI